GLLVAAAILAARLPALSKRGDIHGSAQWATPQDLTEARISQPFGAPGLFLGVDPYHPRRYLRDDGPSHVFVFAPTRSGKGVGLVVPDLLAWPGSVVGHDR